MIKKFTGLSLEAPGCHPGVQIFRADFKLDIDISGLFPYINSEIDNAQYHENPHYIQFSLKDHTCALYPDKILARPFENREQALGFFDELKIFLNDIFIRRDSIKPDHSKQKYIPVLDILKKLPKTNCKECGYLSCMAFASALSKGETEYSRCHEYEN